MVIYTGHWKHSRIWLLNGSLLGPCQALARLVSHTTLAYFAKPPRSGCQRGAGKAIQGGRAAAEVPQLLQDVNWFPSSCWKRPWLGKQSPPGDTFKTAYLQKVLQAFFFFFSNRLVLEMKGKLQIHPEDNVKGQAGISCKRSTCYILREC